MTTLHYTYQLHLGVKRTTYDVTNLAVTMATSSDLLIEQISYD